MDRSLTSSSTSQTSSPTKLNVPPLVQAAHRTISSSSSASQNNPNAAPANPASGQADNLPVLEKERILWAEEHVPQPAQAGSETGGAREGGAKGGGEGAKMGPLGS